MVWFGPCRKRVPITVSQHPDYPNLQRIVCVPTRRIRTCKVGDEQRTIPGAWIREHVCRDCPRSKVVTSIAGQELPGVTLPLGAA